MAPAGDFIPKVRSRNTCDRITWKTHPASPPPPDLLLPSSGCSPGTHMFGGAPQVIIYFFIHLLNMHTVMHYNYNTL